MTLRPIARAAALTSIVTLGSLSLPAYDSGRSGGNGQTNYVVGTDGIATVSKGERKAVGTIKGKTLEGKLLDFAAFKGKVVVINVWDRGVHRTEPKPPTSARSPRQ
ncbi:hypothetical protein [Streptomyces sp. MBT62]|uniref:TlpA family protein disulfide reductase n=1 Tax=Streptomyces sp. MBT62 TaxID=2800410 RepID=UPI0027DE066F|nr:hypothetical protein [Streptomyces sp. MBT62]